MVTISVSDTASSYALRSKLTVQLVLILAQSSIPEFMLVPPAESQDTLSLSAPRQRAKVVKEERAKVAEAKAPRGESHLRLRYHPFHPYRS